MSLTKSFYKKFLNLKTLVIFCLIVLPALLLFNPGIENDTFWLVKMGQHITNEGLPATEPLTYHEGLNIIVQQWLTSVIFYKIYLYTGMAGLILFTATMFVILLLLLYLIFYLMTRGNRNISIGMIFIVIGFLSLFSMPRPQIVSYILFALEILVLEKYIETKKTHYLIALPIISILMVNLHAAMWIMFFVIMIPYFFDGFQSITKLFKLESHKSNKYILIALICSLIVGFFNPYGINGMLYSIKSFGCGTDFITEMKSPDFKTEIGILYFLYFLITILIFSYSKSNRTLRGILMTIGMGYLALASVRSFPLLLICSSPFLAHCLIGYPDGFVEQLEKNKRILSIIILILLAGIARNFIKFSNSYENLLNNSYYIPKDAVEYIIANVDQDKMKLYNNYNTGGYIEFMGIKTFIDSRAEVFIKKMNGKDDILQDYINIQFLQKQYYKDIFKKYGFTHWLVKKGSNLDIIMNTDTEFETIYQDDMFVIYTTTG